MNLLEKRKDYVVGLRTAFTKKQERACGLVE
jgi:hypothetical protein